jgi:peptide/nickel transport system substrate-binding protein
VGSCSARWRCYGLLRSLLYRPLAIAKLAARFPIQAVMYDQAPAIPWGRFAQPAAYRANLRNLIPSAIPIFWNVEK